MAYVKSFRELDVYKVGRGLSNKIYRLSKGFPAEERYSLTDQIRRSSRSVGAQIAEAWAKRRYKRHFISKLTDADGEQQETQHWILSGLDGDLIQEEQARQLLAEYEILGMKLQTMINKADQFCQED
jgi:four helix bundle protein